MLYRRAFAMSYYSSEMKFIKRWAWMDTENSNFYYKLTQLNMDQLAQTICSITSKSYEEVYGYFDELESDEELRQHLKNGLVSSTYGRDIQIHYGRRIGWYALVRCLKPKVIIETGVDHGVGSCVLTSALIRNHSEGYDGKYYGTDNNPEAGQLLRGKYAAVGEILYGDSITSLKNFSDPIDFFINDSDHSAEYEYDEYETIKNNLAKNSIILGDNSHVTNKLSKFSRVNNRKFIFFSEKPEGHWYPGAGIGISFLSV